MKDKFIICSLLILCLLIGCGMNSTTVMDEMVNDSSTSEQEVLEVSVEMEEINWKSIYYDYLSRPNSYGRNYFHNGIQAFAIAYINDDDIPEIFMQGVSHADGIHVLTIADGQVCDCNSGYFDYYIEKGNLLNATNGWQGYMLSEVYYIDSDIGWVNIFTGESGEEYDNSGTFYPICRVDGTDVDEEIYQKKFAEVYDESKSIEPDYSLTAKDIIIFLTGDEKLAEAEISKKILDISIDGIGQRVMWEENESVSQLKDYVGDGITFGANGYNDVGLIINLSHQIDSSDKEIHVDCGDVLLVNGNQILVCTQPSVGVYTKLGKITSIDFDTDVNNTEIVIGTSF